MIKTSVVIPCHNVEKTLQFQLDALAKQSSKTEFEVIVVDNLSNDGTVKVAQSHTLHLHKRLKIVNAHQGLGINIARNAGIQAAAGELILICDGDDIVTSSWVVAYETAFASSSKRPHGILWTGPVDEYALNLWRKAPGGKLQTSPPQFRGLAYAQGCNMGFTKETISQLGLFNVQLQRGFTEVELVLRPEARDLSVRWVQDAVVLYRLPPTTLKRLKRAYRYGVGTRIALENFDFQVNNDRLHKSNSKVSVGSADKATTKQKVLQFANLELLMSKIFWRFGYIFAKSK
jgi:glycosyltransferase involved in cell wall biosynthesis